MVSRLAMIVNFLNEMIFLLASIFGELRGCAMKLLLDLMCASREVLARFMRNRTIRD